MCVVDMALVLTKKIYQSYPQGFCSFSVLGRRGIGKSSYSLRALHDCFVMMGYSDNQAWREALSCLKFKIVDVVAYLKDAVDRDEKKVALIWDDARIFAGGSQYFLQMKMVNKLTGMLDAIRTAISCLILTCPSQQGLLSILKFYDDFMVKIKYSESGGFNRVATGYLWTTLPSNQRRVYTKFRDSFSCRLPNWVYEDYMVKRKSALKEILVELEETVKE